MGKNEKVPNASESGGVACYYWRFSPRFLQVSSEHLSWLMDVEGKRYYFIK